MNIYRQEYNKIRNMDYKKYSDQAIVYLASTFIENTLILAPLTTYNLDSPWIFNPSNSLSSPFHKIRRVSELDNKLYHLFGNDSFSIAPIIEPHIIYNLITKMTFASDRLFSKSFPQNSSLDSVSINYSSDLTYVINNDIICFMSPFLVRDLLYDEISYDLEETYKYNSKEVIDELLDIYRNGYNVLEILQYDTSDFMLALDIEDFKKFSELIRDFYSKNEDIYVNASHIQLDIIDNIFTQYTTFKDDICPVLADISCYYDLIDKLKIKSSC